MIPFTGFPFCRRLGSFCCSSIQETTSGHPDLWHQLHAPKLGPTVGWGFEDGEIGEDYAARWGNFNILNLESSQSKMYKM